MDGTKDESAKNNTIEQASLPERVSPDIAKRIERIKSGTPETYFGTEGSKKPWDEIVLDVSEILNAYGVDKTKAEGIVKDSLLKRKNQGGSDNDLFFIIRNIVIGWSPEKRAEHARVKAEIEQRKNEARAARKDAQEASNATGPGPDTDRTVENEKGTLKIPHPENVREDALPSENEVPDEGVSTIKTELMEASEGYRAVEFGKLFETREGRGALLRQIERAEQSIRGLYKDVLGLKVADVRKLDASGQIGGYKYFEHLVKEVSREITGFGVGQEVTSQNVIFSKYHALFTTKDLVERGLMAYIEEHAPGTQNVRASTEARSVSREPATAPPPDDLPTGEMKLSAEPVEPTHADDAASDTPEVVQAEPAAAETKADLDTFKGWAAAAGEKNEELKKAKAEQQAVQTDGTEDVEESATDAGDAMTPEVVRNEIRADTERIDAWLKAVQKKRGLTSDPMRYIELHNDASQRVREILERPSSSDTGGTKELEDMKAGLDAVIKDMEKLQEPYDKVEMRFDPYKEGIDAAITAARDGLPDDPEAPVHKEFAALENGIRENLRHYKELLRSSARAGRPIGVGKAEEIRNEIDTKVRQLATLAERSAAATEPEPADDLDDVDGNDERIQETIDAVNNLRSGLDQEAAADVHMGRAKKLFENIKQHRGTYFTAMAAALIASWFLGHEMSEKAPTPMPQGAHNTFPNKAPKSPLDSGHKSSHESTEYDIGHDQVTPYGAIKKPGTGEQPAAKQTEAVKEMQPALQENAAPVEAGAQPALQEQAAPAEQANLSEGPAHPTKEDAQFKAQLEQFGLPEYAVQKDDNLWKICEARYAPLLGGLSKRERDKFIARLLEYLESRDGYDTLQRQVGVVVGEEVQGAVDFHGIRTSTDRIYEGEHLKMRPIDRLALQIYNSREYTSTPALEPASELAPDTRPVSNIETAVAEAQPIEGYANTTPLAQVSESNVGGNVSVQEASFTVNDRSVEEVAASVSPELVEKTRKEWVDLIQGKSEGGFMSHLFSSQHEDAYKAMEGNMIAELFAQGAEDRVVADLKIEKEKYEKWRDAVASWQNNAHVLVQDGETLGAYLERVIRLSFAVAPETQNA